MAATIETDYLGVGAGTSGLSFTDALVAAADAEVVIVDRRSRPGGHWVDAYPFVRLHQPSATYGVPSRTLGANRIDTGGPNAGWYERARGIEVADYYAHVVDDVLVGPGRVRFSGLTDYRGEDADGHHLVSLVTGAETVVKVRRKIVDATYVESSIPSRHTPGFAIGDGVGVVPPNALSDLAGAPRGFTVIGAGKTAMDTCCWLLEQGVDPDRIRWIKPGEGWFFNRATVQPLALVGTYMQMQGDWLESAAAAEDGADFARRLEARGVFMRVDPAFEPRVFRGATVSQGELDALRSIERVVRKGRVSGITPSRVTLVDGEEPGAVDELYVDCTAPGVRPTQPRPMFEPGRVTPQYAVVGQVSWGAAIAGTVEALRDDDAEKNRLCPPVVFSGRAVDLLDIAHQSLKGTLARRAEADLAAWEDRCRLNPASAARDHLDDPAVGSGLTAIMAAIGPAMANLEARSAGAPV